MDERRAISHKNVEAGPQRYVFLLLENFTLLSFAAAVDTLRQANRQAEKELYAWRLISPDGEPARCSNGTTLSVHGGLDPIDRNEIVCVVGGIQIKAASTKPVLMWLRREARKGVKIGGICTAAYTLATAGLLDNRSCTIHWENRDSFSEEFPDLDLKHGVYEISGNRFTSSGGTSSSDLFLKIITLDHNAELASKVADGIIHTTIRTEQDQQRLSIPTRIGVRHTKLATVIQRMEDNIEEPISPSLLAAGVHMSTRQLERLFRRYLDRSPKRYYMELRLKKARNLLMQTDMSVINVALACGFASPSHFSKCYRAHFSTTPYRERGTNATTTEAVST
jgi:transcriptional regulator GlxA family with amidase domain